MEERLIVPKSQLVFGSLVYWITVLAATFCIIGPLIAFINMDGNVINPHYEMKNIFDGMRSDFAKQSLQADAVRGSERLAVEDAGKFDDPDTLGHDVQIRIVGNDGIAELATVTAIDKENNVLELSDGLLNSWEMGQAEITQVTIWDAKGTVRLTADAQADQDVIQLASTDTIDDPTAEHPIALVIEDANNREEVLVRSIDRDANTVRLAAPLSSSYSVSNEATVTQATVGDEAKGGHFWLHHITGGDGFTQLGLVLGCAVGIPAMVGAALFFAIKERSIGWAIAALTIAAIIAVPAFGLVTIG